MEGVTRAQHEQDFTTLSTSMELLNSKVDSILVAIHTSPHGHAPQGNDQLHPTRRTVPHLPSTAAAMPISLPTPVIPPPTSDLPPVARHCIPALKQQGNEPKWKGVVRDWQLADPTRGLDTPLGQWPKEWYSDKSRMVHASKYNQRRLIALEYLEMCVPQAPTLYYPLTRYL